MQSRFDGVFLKRTAQFRAGILRERRRSSVATIDKILWKIGNEKRLPWQRIIINFDTRLNLHNPLDYTKTILFFELLILIGLRTNLLIAAWLTLTNRLAKKKKKVTMSRRRLYSFINLLFPLILDFFVVEISKKISLTKKRGKNKRDIFSITKSFFSLSFTFHGLWEKYSTRFLDERETGRRDTISMAASSIMGSVRGQSLPPSSR